MVQLNNNLLIPVKPVGIQEDYPLSILKDITLLNYSKTLKVLVPFLKDLKIDISYITKIVEDKTTTALQLYNYIIPIYPTPLVKDNIEIKQYKGYSVNINNDIASNTKLHNNRTININKIKFEEESYIRYRLTISKYINIHKNIKKQIKDIISSSDKLQQKKNKMQEIIKK